MMLMGNAAGLRILGSPTAAKWGAVRVSEPWKCPGDLLTFPTQRELTAVYLEYRIWIGSRFGSVGVRSAFLRWTGVVVRSFAQGIYNAASG